MNHRILPIWAGGIIGVAAAAALTWLLREATQSFETATVPDLGNLTSATWLLVLAGVAVAVVLWAGRLHALIVGVPTLWFLILFGPILVVDGVPGWYPEWLARQALTDTNPVSFVVLGLLVAATVDAAIRRRTSTTEDEPST